MVSVTAIMQERKELAMSAAERNKLSTKASIRVECP